jgi:pSer/pThr/pTyr-binding forkhead associated (FHA) protein
VRWGGRMPEFIVRMAGRKEMSIVLDEDDVFIGRAPRINDICIGDPSVSRQHAHVKRREEGYAVYDLKSLNGVFLNGEKISRAVLKDGDVIRLGDVEVRVRIREVSAEESLASIEESEITSAEARAVQPVGEEKPEITQARKLPQPGK